MEVFIWIFFDEAFVNAKCWMKLEWQSLVAGLLFEFVVQIICYFRTLTKRMNFIFCVYVATCNVGLYHVTLFVHGGQTQLVVFRPLGTHWVLCETGRSSEKVIREICFRYLYRFVVVIKTFPILYMCKICDKYGMDLWRYRNLNYYYSNRIDCRWCCRV